MAEKHFYEQQKFSRSYLIPYLNRHIPNFDQATILEIGCGEAGFLDVLQQNGKPAVGIEIEANRIKTALAKNPALKILEGDITDPSIVKKLNQTFAVIVMRDVIEHIKDRQATFANLRELLNPGGYLYITFPPRFSGFAGHQQNGRTILRYLPYLHLLPVPLIRFLAKIFREREDVISQVIINYQIGLTVRQFTKLCKNFHFAPIIKELFLFRPIYQVRFNLTPRRIPNIPILREFLAFGCEYLLRKDS